MFKIFIFLFFIFFSNSFSNILDISNNKNLETFNYITFINDSKNIYTYEDINNNSELKILA